MSHTRPTPHTNARVLVDSGQDPDIVRSYYELPTAICDRLHALGTTADTIAENITQALDAAERLPTVEQHRDGLLDDVADYERRLVEKQATSAPADEDGA